MSFLFSTSFSLFSIFSFSFLEIPPAGFIPSLTSVLVRFSSSYMFFKCIHQITSCNCSVVGSTRRVIKISRLLFSFNFFLVVVDIFVIQDLIVFLIYKIIYFSRNLAEPRAIFEQF